MKVLITSIEAPEHQRVIDRSSLRYNKKDVRFELPAHGHIISSHKPFKPSTVEVNDSQLKIVFTTITELDDFCMWLNDAESAAIDSFYKMLD